MVDNEEVNSADKLRDAATALGPDARARTTVAMRSGGSVSMVTLEERHADVSQFDLILAVPLDIRVHFETAKNLYLYAWFVYRLYPVAEQQALATLEFGLRARLAMLYPDLYGPNSKWIPGLSKMLEAARKDGLFSNSGVRATERWAMRRARDRVSDDATRRLIESGAEFIEFDPDRRLMNKPSYSCKKPSPRDAPMLAMAGKQAAQPKAETMLPKVPALSAMREISVIKCLPWSRMWLQSAQDKSVVKYGVKRYMQNKLESLKSSRYCRIAATARRTHCSEARTLAEHKLIGIRQKNGGPDTD